MRFLLILIAAALLASCAAQKTAPPSAQSYYEEGERLFEKGRYDEAISAWEKVRESYQSPELTAAAELKIAGAHFKAGHYMEAAAAYEDFLKQHPGHEKTPEVLYLLGMSYFNQMLSADRDQTATRNALVTFENLRDRFPDHPRAEEAAERIGQTRERLASHELYVGRFYLRTDEPRSAISRLKDLPSLYPDFTRLDEAYFLLGRAYMEEGRDQEARETFNRLTERYPSSEYVPRASKYLAENL